MVRTFIVESNARHFLSRIRRFYDDPLLDDFLRLRRSVLRRPSAPDSAQSPDKGHEEKPSPPPAKPKDLKDAVRRIQDLEARLAEQDQEQAATKAEFELKLKLAHAGSLCLKRS